MRQIGPCPERKLHAARKVKERDRAMFEFLTNDPFSRQAKSLAIKANSVFEIGDAQRQNGNTWLHVDTHCYRRPHHADTLIVLGCHLLIEGPATRGPGQPSRT